MDYEYTYKCLYKNGLYSDLKLIINDKEYNLHTKFLTPKSEFFKCLFNNPQMNIIDPITIIGCNGEKINSVHIDEIIKWFYHNDNKYINNLCDDINLEYDFNCVLDYYYISDYLQISKLIEKCKDIMDNYFKMLFNIKEDIKKNIKDFLLENIYSYNVSYNYKFKKDSKYIDIDNHENFLSLIKPILNKLNELNKLDISKIINFDNYDIIFKNIMKYFPIYNENLFKNFSNNNRRDFMLNIKKFLDGLFTFNYSFYTNLYNIGFYDLNILLKKDDKIRNSCLVRLLDINELIVDNKIINEKTKELEEICIKYDIYDEYITKMEYLFQNYKKYIK